MEKLIYSQKVMESAVEIANTAGHYRFKTPNSRDMMSDFVAWAIEFESTPYEDESWLELIEAFSIHKLVVEIEKNRATSDFELPRIVKVRKLTSWLLLKDSAWVYLPEHSETIYTKGRFVELCKGDEKQAYLLFTSCEWQTPETIIDEYGGYDEWFNQLFGVTQ